VTRHSLPSSEVACVLDDYDTFMELQRQLAVVRRRIDETVAALADAKGSLSAEGLAGVAAAAMFAGKGDLFQLCVRLEVALAESRETADQLAKRLKQLADGDPLGGPWPDPPDERDPLGGPQDWQQ
jgi:hypothetical protein